MSPYSLNTGEQRYAIKSWRYLRLAMVALVVGLFVSIAFERGKAPANCFQTSISAYYYTPVHDYFVAGLLAIGVCLFCLRGSSDEEDGLLNLAGMFAPIVALVPTPNPGKCASVFGSLEDRSVNIANNITALIAVGVLAGIILGGLTVRKRSPRVEPQPSALKMFAVAAAVWILLMLVFWGDRAFFIKNAHYAAAIAMFSCILIVVLLNAWGYKEKRTEAGKEARRLRNPYAYVGGAMIVSSLITGIAGLFGWDHWVIVIEFALITLFAIFWVIQTIELWDDGLRSDTSR